MNDRFWCLKQGRISIRTELTSAAQIKTESNLHMQISCFSCKYLCITNGLMILTQPLARVVNFTSIFVYQSQSIETAVWFNSLSLWFTIAVLFEEVLQCNWELKLWSYLVLILVEIWLTEFLVGSFSIEIDIPILNLCPRLAFVIFLVERRYFLCSYFRPSCFISQRGHLLLFRVNKCQTK